MTSLAYPLATMPVTCSIVNTSLKESDSFTIPFPRSGGTTCAEFEALVTAFMLASRAISSQDRIKVLFDPPLEKCDAFGVFPSQTEPYCIHQVVKSATLSPDVTKKITEQLTRGPLTPSHLSLLKADHAVAAYMASLATDVASSFGGQLVADLDSRALYLKHPQPIGRRRPMCGRGSEEAVKW